MLSDGFQLILYKWFEIVWDGFEGVQMASAWRIMANGLGIISGATQVWDQDPSRWSFPWSWLHWVLPSAHHMISLRWFDVWCFSKPHFWTVASCLSILRLACRQMFHAQTIDSMVKLQDAVEKLWETQCMRNVLVGNKPRFSNSTQFSY